MFFVRAVSPSGRVVLERDWEWPGMEQQVPPGILPGDGLRPGVCRELRQGSTRR